MPTESPLPQNDPMLIAFQKLKHTPEYANAVNWSLQAKSPSEIIEGVQVDLWEQRDSRNSPTARVRNRRENEIWIH